VVCLIFPSTMRVLTTYLPHRLLGVLLPLPGRLPSSLLHSPPERGHETPSHSTVHHVSAKEHVDGSCPRTALSPRERQCRPRDVAARWPPAHVARDCGPGWRRTGRYQQSGHHRQGAQPPARSPRHVVCVRRGVSWSLGPA